MLHRKPILTASLLLLLAAPSLTVLPACGDDTGEGGAPSTDKHLVVLFTSDEHSHLFAFSPELDDDPEATTAGSGDLVGGVARRAAVLAKERQAAKDAKKDSILLSAGDNQMGCLPHLAFQSASIDYGTMKALGYDATTFGNHEFDFGPGPLSNSIEAALAGSGLPPIVASNIHFSADASDDDALAGYFSEDVTDDKPIHPYRVITTEGGIKVGLVGYVGINAAHVAPNKGSVEFSVRPANFETDGDVQAGLPSLYADLQPIVDELRDTEKVDVVIAMAHGGINDSATEAGLEAGEDTQICDNVSGIDLIISGHAHNHDPKPIQRTNKSTNAPCLVLNAGAFGIEVGRVELTIDADKNVTWDTTTQALVPVDDTTIPDPEVGATIGGYVEGIEEASSGPGGSELAHLLSSSLEQSISNDPQDAGDLYFHPVGATDFDVEDTHALVWLSADAMLSQADDYAVITAGPQTDLAVESAGVIRSVLKKGKTGTISAADAFNVVPLGSSPVDGSIGYPLIRGYVLEIELRGVAEFALARDPNNSDYDIGFAGVKVEYDATRPPATSLADLVNPDKGKVMRMSLDTDHTDGYEQFDEVIFDREAGIGDPTRSYSFVTSSYIGQFATDAGVTIKDAAGDPLALVDAILPRGDNTEYKQIEAFFRYLSKAPGGKLQSTYDASSSSFTKRFICLKGC
ncbi:MAG: 5'-nucleotidase C-terminal domain-containing protein [Polyangiaceae bacterium]